MRLSQIGRVMVCALLALTFGERALAQVPGPASPGVAAGVLVGDRLTFSWGAVPHSTWYYLWVNDSTGNRLKQWFTAAQAGCETTPLCSVSVDLTLTAGHVYWWVQTWSPSGYGPWSEGRTVRTSGFLQTSNAYGTVYLGTTAPTATNTGALNTAVGDQALVASTTGDFNTAVGGSAMRFNTTGFWNTALGAHALRANTTGDSNTAVGAFALYANTEGRFNTAVGVNALGASAMSSNNTAIGYDAMGDSDFTHTGNTAIGREALRLGGTDNIAIGAYAGFYGGNKNITIGNGGAPGDEGVIRIGNSNQTKAYIAGIYDAAISTRQVYVSSSGQLGTLSSSQRTKHGIANMGNGSARIFDLRPVSFKYLKSIDPSQETQYGLIAEEVAEVLPELVDRGTSGEPETVRYHLLAPMLLNELQKTRSDLQKTRADLDAATTDLRELKARLAALEALVQQK